MVVTEQTPSDRVEDMDLCFGSSVRVDRLRFVRANAARIHIGERLIGSGLALTIRSTSRDRGGLSSVRQARDLAVAEGVDEQPVIVAHDLRVSGAEAHHLLDELHFVAAERLDDLVLRLEADYGWV